MSKKSKHVPSASARAKLPLSAEAMNHMVALYNSNQWDTLIVTAQEATKSHPEHFFGWKALGKALLKSNHFAEAIEPLTRITKISPNDVDAYNDLAVSFQNLGQFEEAAACYRRLIKLGQVSANVYDTLGTMLCNQGKYQEAEAEFRYAVLLDPGYIQAHINLAFATTSLERFDEAEACYRKALTLNPHFSEIHRRLGDLLSRMPGRSAEAIVYLERAIALNPQDVGSIVTLGNVLMGEKRLEESQAMFLKARQIQPLITWSSKKAQPDFSVLMLDAPGAGSTPVNYLAGRADYECHFIGVMPGITHDIDLLNAKADVVFNMIGDADNGKDVLPLALDIADRVDRPIINHPRKIMATDRESIASRLAGIALCRIPRTLRVTAAELATPDGQKLLEQFTLPILIRCAGTHGGDDFEKVDSTEAIHSFISRHAEATLYLSEFVDYRSADGYYRKYRLIAVNNEILPYHLAIHSDWMVHHFRTDMANQLWMRQEEEDFLKNPHHVFSPEHFAAFKNIASAVGLDYCGIDCSLDQSGNIVVFESNATMLVHDEKNATFSYKNPYIAKIKIAFDEMLTNIVASHRALTLATGTTA